MSDANLAKILEDAKTLTESIFELFDEKNIDPKVGVVAASYVASLAAIRCGADIGEFKKLSEAVFNIVNITMGGFVKDLEGTIPPIDPNAN